MTDAHTTFSAGGARIRLPHPATGKPVVPQGLTPLGGGIRVRFPVKLPSSTHATLPTESVTLFGSGSTQFGTSGADVAILPQASTPNVAVPPSSSESALPVGTHTSLPTRSSKPTISILPKTVSSSITTPKTITIVSSTSIMPIMVSTVEASVTSKATISATTTRYTVSKSIPDGGSLLNMSGKRATVSTSSLTNGGTSKVRIAPGGQALIFTPNQPLQFSDDDDQALQIDSARKS